MNKKVNEKFSDNGLFDVFKNMKPLTMNHIFYTSPSEPIVEHTPVQKEIENEKIIKIEEKSNKEKSNVFIKIIKDVLDFHKKAIDDAFDEDKKATEAYKQFNKDSNVSNIKMLEFINNLTFEQTINEDFIIGHESKKESELSKKEQIELSFMRELINTPGMKKLFEDSPKNGNIKFNLSSDSAPLSIVTSSGQSCIVKGFSEINNLLGLNVPSSAKESLLFNQKEKDWEKELIARHELNHCRFNDFKNPLMLSSNPKLNENLNKLSSSNDGQILSKKINENFVEVLAVMQMLKENDTPEFRKFIEKHTIKRDISSVAFLNEKSLHAHSGIPTALKILMQKDNLNDLANISVDNSEQMQKKALIIANEALRMELAQMTKSERRNVYFEVGMNMEMPMKGALTKEISKYAPEEMKNAKIANFSGLYYSYSDNSGIIQQAAKIYVDELKKKDPEKFNTMLKDVINLGVNNEGQEKVSQYSINFREEVVSKPNKYFGKEYSNIFNKLDDELVQYGMESQKKMDTETSKTYSENEIEGMKLNVAQKGVADVKSNQTGYLKISPDFANKLEKIQTNFESATQHFNVEVRGKKM